MARIGNRKDAKFILEWYREHGRNKDTPEGWKMLGSGSYRIAFLHVESDVVYKVDRWADTSDGYESNVEVRHARTLWRQSGGTGILGTRFRVPKVSGFNFTGQVVVAMEAIRGVLMADHGDDTVCPEGRFELYQIGRFGDMHPYNFFIDENGYAVPVDMASPRSSKHPDLRVLTGTHHYDDERRARGWL